MATNASFDQASASDGAPRIQLDELELLLPGLEAALAAGRSIQVVRGESVVAEVWASGDRPKVIRAQDFDFAAQRQRLWGDRVFDVDSTQWIREDRDGE